jgi:O-antigen ligase
MKINYKNYLHIGIIIIYSIIGLIPNYGAIDRIAPQFLFFSIINLFGLVYLWAYLKIFKNIILKIFKYKPFIFLTFFVFYGLISYLYADNQVEVFVKFFRWINILIGLLIISSLLYLLEKRFLIVSIIFTIVLLIELYFPYDTYFQLISLTDYNIQFGNLLKGASGNKNIAAASILIKIPFVFYLMSEIKNKLIRSLLVLILVLSFYLIFLLSARAAILSTLLSLIAIVIFNIIRYFKTKKTKAFLNSVLYLILPVLFSIGLFQFQYGLSDNDVSITSRAASINTEDESTKQRIRFYEHSVDQIFNNPIIGVGLGNWKFKSIDYDKDNIQGFTVPYHVHNDFLEFGAELGLVGLFLYLAIFIYIVFFIIKSFSDKSIYMSLVPKALVFILGGLVYFIDANLNFPHARMVIQIPFIFYVALFFQFKTNSIDNEKL